MQENFLAYRRYFWGKLTLVSSLILVSVYWLSSQRVAPNGATYVGLTYGILSFIAILLLMYYGRRKRAYTAKRWTLRAWLSFHVYVGMMTLLLVPLHAGFKFGVDMHTLAYALLVLVVLSGMVGGGLYLALPRRFSALGHELTYENESDAELGRIMRDMRRLAVDKSQAFAEICQQELSYGMPTQAVGWRLLWQKPEATPALAAQIQAFEGYLDRLPVAEHGAFHNLARLATQKRDLTHRITAQMRLQNLLEAWLYVHLPLSIVMFLAVLAHIAVVFYYGYIVSH